MTVIGPREENADTQAMQDCEVGPFRLPGVTVDRSRFTDTQFEEMQAWVKENHGWATDTGLFSWKNSKHRNWFWLKWGGLQPQDK